MGKRVVQEADSSLQAGEKDTLYDQRNGVRCIKISPNGKHLASGDRAGNIRYPSQSLPPSGFIFGLYESRFGSSVKSFKN